MQSLLVIIKLNLKSVHSSTNITLLTAYTISQNKQLSYVYIYIYSVYFNYTHKKVKVN